MCGHQDVHIFNRRAPMVLSTSILLNGNIISHDFFVEGAMAKCVNLLFAS